jgi:hypothetical protein
MLLLDRMRCPVAAIRTATGSTRSGPASWWTHAARGVWVLFVSEKWIPFEEKKSKIIAISRLLVETVYKNLPMKHILWVAIHLD